MECRWQYAVVDIGLFNAASRLLSVLGALGSDGWQLVHVYDKASNWLSGMEKGFVLFKRPVVGDAAPPGDWAMQFDAQGRLVRHEVVDY